MKFAKVRGSLLFFLAAILLFKCVSNLAGNLSQTGNGIVTGVLYNADGSFAENATVCVREKNALADIPGSLTGRNSVTTITVVTDNNGRFSIDSIDTGVYVIEGTDGRNNVSFNDSVVVRSPDSIVIVPPDTLKPAGAIKGVIELSEGGDPRKVFVRVFGIDRFAIAEADGRFKFENLAEGNYHMQILPMIDLYGVFDTTNIPMQSADTNDIGVIELPLTGIPTVRNVTISYDTLQQQVTVRWSRPDAACVKSFNMYRRSIDPLSAIFTQLNFCPIFDTVYVDSLCEHDKTYEYRVAAVDSNATEGARSSGAEVRTALYDLPPGNATISYDTVRQTVTLRWSNPDAARVTGYNVYRRNIRLNEKFWTPFNNRPIVDTVFIDSTFILCPTSDIFCDDSMAAQEPTYEYCVAALMNDIRETVRSAGMPVRISVQYLLPASVHFSYDTITQSVHLRWSRRDTTLVKTYNIYRRNADASKSYWSQLNRTPVDDTAYADSTGEQNQAYEYCVASIVNNNRAEVKSAGVTVRIASSFTADTAINVGTGSGQLRNPSDIAVSANGDVYIADQGNARVQVFDSTMQYKKQFGTGVLDAPLKLSVDGRGSVYAANYNAQKDSYSIFVFDSSGTPIDTIPDCGAISDFDVRDGLLYVLTQDQIVSIVSHEGSNKRSWRISDPGGCKGIIAAEAKTILVGAGSASSDVNKVMVFDSLGNKVSSMPLPSVPIHFAFDGKKQLLYVVCFAGADQSVLYVLDADNALKASYKIQSDDQKVSIGLQKNGDVLLVLRNEGRIIRLKPLL